MFEWKVDENVSLKLIDHHDAEALFALIQDSRAHLREWLPWLDYNTELQHTKEFIESSLVSYSKQQSVTTLMLSKGQPAGVCTLRYPFSFNQTASIGYWIAPAFTGNGIVTKASQALTNYAFLGGNVDKVEIRAAVENKKSRNVPERLGFVQEGTIRQEEWLYDHYVDIVVYGLLKSEWLQREHTKSGR
ncbi:ribosomal-protein-serine N-acetyltransferase [Fictibacillus macauensis ZFHKF-1]|uniref:Ribosomal-protein-serine N-acetyltransferase n=1 Tax=Fictibacillus macauensis ZFHKF-1 TaxID=1196324 RepID=I8AG12_9BACL|nr:GNAT family protein [Fictibacillus macauensis]EIT84329.1 ribosomal-protein-serine N-acetyltransferase [Fictibacillus macauensis ZFHKF-1]